MTKLEKQAFEKYLDRKFGHIYEHFDRLEKHLNGRFNHLEAGLRVLWRKENETMSLVTDIKAKVTNNTSALDSLAITWAALKAKLDAAIAAGGDVVMLQEISDALDVENAKILSTAALANTSDAPPA